MPILSDALEGAGCTNAALLLACRGNSLAEQSWALYRIMFDLKINPNGHVTFTLPKEMSYYEAIKGIHEIKGQQPCVHDKTRPPAVWSELLLRLAREADANRPSKHCFLPVLNSQLALRRTSQPQCLHAVASRVYA